MKRKRHSHPPGGNAELKGCLQVENLKWEARTLLNVYYTPLGGKSGSEAAHALLARAWEDWRGGAALPPLVYLPNGKPDFAHTAHCSLTHTKTLAAVALCETSVGVDAETIRRVNSRLPLRVLAAEELAWLERAGERDEAFLRLWTLKEAYLKYTGEGLRHWPSGLCFTMEGDSPSLFGAPELAFGTMRREDCVLAWCAPKPQEDVLYRRLC